jgi:hypothetical protein
MIVGGLLGLVVGVSLAALLEALRPTLDRATLPRHLGAPLLGSVRWPSRQAPVVKDPWLADYVTVAAEKAGVQSVQLVPVGRRPVDVYGLARSLNGREGAHADGVSVDALVLPGGAQEDGVLPDLPRRTDAGIVVVAPEVVTGRDLSRLERHVQVTGQPVIGVITYRGRSPVAVEEQNLAIDAEYRSAVARDAAPSAAPAS